MYACRSMNVCLCVWVCVRMCVGLRVWLCVCVRDVCCIDRACVFEGEMCISEEVCVCVCVWICVRVCVMCVLH